MNQPILDSYKSYGCRINAISVNELFRRYKQVGFLYPEKLKRLAPYWELVQENWKKAERGGELLHYIISVEMPHGAWASLTSWRHTDNGWNTQHLAGHGSPKASRAVMLATQAVTLHDGIHQSHQNWFRRKNRFANKVFGSIQKSVSSESSWLKDYTYFAFDKSPLQTCINENCIHVRKMTNSDRPAIEEFVNKTRSNVYFMSEGLGQTDLGLQCVDELYRKVGLYRFREIWVAEHPSKGSFVGMALAYHGPLGLNFSFLENRCDVIVSSEISKQERHNVFSSLINSVAPSYANEPLQKVLVVTDVADTSTLENLGGEKIRDYTQSVWLRQGYESFYRHVEQIYSRVDAALDRRARRLNSASEERSSSSTYFMDDKREAKRLAQKVNASEWVAQYLSPYIKSAADVLDVGCGPGIITNAAALAYPDKQFVGVDLSRERFEENRINAALNLDLKIADACSLPFPDESFDLIYCRLLLEYLNNRELAVREMYRVCKPGGYVILQDLDGQLVWHYPEDPELQHQVQIVIKGLAKTGFDPFVGRQLFGLAKSVGLKEIEVDVEKYHLFAGQIDPENEALWKTKLDIALPMIEKIVGDLDVAHQIHTRFLNYLRRDDTLTYSVVFTVVGRKK